MDAKPEAAEQGIEPRVLAQRIGERRRQLGVGEMDLATRVGMAPRYLQQVLDAGPDFDRGGYVRIAAALDMTYEELLEGRADLPPGQDGPADRPVLVRLTESECWDKLGTHGLGRVAFPVDPGPAVVPVNYAVDAHTIAYRTAPGTTADPSPDVAMSFQADWFDEQLRQGWSVLVTGNPEHVGDPEAAGRLAELATEPWAGGDRPLWIRIRPRKVTGRRVSSM
ncbi:pyridoxamine 5'-phosphate oxidase family protein [Streptomyces sp. NBC_00433]